MSKEHKFFSNVFEFDFDKEKESLIHGLDELKSMSVEEFTLFKKWEEINKQFEIKNIASSVENTERRIWRPSNIYDEKSTINEIENLDPEIIYVSQNDENYYDSWNNLRIFCHTMEFNQTPGRFLRFIILDRNTRKYLGILSVSSEVISIKDRDLYLGWTSDNKLKNKKLDHSSIGSCIMATQPFGYNFLGTKLMACLATSDVVRNKWSELYKQILVGMTTTSLYSSYSVYNSLKWWHKCGKSSGKMLIKPHQSSYDVFHEWIKENRKDEYQKIMTQKDGVSGPVTSPKTKVLSLIMNSCGIKMKNYTHGFSRGTYYSTFYENTKEFLQNKITESDLVIKPLIKNGISEILNWWKPKAIDRYKKLLSEKKLKPEILSYLSMINMSYEKSKYKYLNDVGR